MCIYIYIYTYIHTLYLVCCVCSVVADSRASLSMRQAAQCAETGSHDLPGAASTCLVLARLSFYGMFVFMCGLFAYAVLHTDTVSMHSPSVLFVVGLF